MKNSARFRELIQDMTEVVEKHGDDEARLLDAAAPLLGKLIATDDWLPDEYAAPSDQSYRQYLLYRDPAERFSVVSFVWQPGQRTPVHDHTVWGLVGVLRGEERCDQYAQPVPGAPPKLTGTHRMTAGQVDRVSPRIGDVHAVSNSGAGTAISIHIYGASIGEIRRHAFDPRTGGAREFISGYDNGSLPTLWDRSGEGVSGATAKGAQGA